MSQQSSTVPLGEVVAVVTGRARNIAMAALMLSMFFAMASNTMVLTGMPKIIDEVGGGQAEYTWIVTASILTLTVSTPIWARLADRVDRKVLMQLAVAIYVLATLGAGFSTSAWMIVFFRFLGGIGAGGLVTMVQLIVTGLTTIKERPKYFGYLGAMMAVATVAAPALGGIVVDVGGWRWCFFSTVPLAFIALVMLQVGLRGQSMSAPRSATVRFDYLGAVLVTTTTLVLMLWLTVVGKEAGWFSLPSAGMLVVVALGVWVSVIVESRAEAPMIPLELLKRLEMLKVLGASAAISAATFAGSVYIAQYLQSARDMSTGAAGLLLVPMAAATFVSSIVAGRYISKTSRHKFVVVGGTLITIAGTAPWITAAVDSWTPMLIGATVLMGFGLGAVGQQLVVVAQLHLNADEINVGTALLMFVRSIATVILLCVFSLLVDSRIEATPGAEGYAAGAGLVFLVVTISLVIAAVLLARMRPTEAHSR